MARALRNNILTLCGWLALGAAVQAQTLSVPAKLVLYPDLIVHNGKIVSMDDIILRALAPDAPDSREIVDSLREIVLHHERNELADPPAASSLGG